MLDVLLKRVEDLDKEVQKSMQMHNALFGRFMEAKHLLEEAKKVAPIAEEVVQAVANPEAAIVEGVADVVEKVAC